MRIFKIDHIKDVGRNTCVICNNRLDNKYMFDVRVLSSKLLNHIIVCVECANHLHNFTNEVKAHEELLKLVKEKYTNYLDPYKDKGE